MEITLGLSRLHGWLLYPLCFFREIKFVHKGNTNTTIFSQARPALVILESSIDDICKSTTLPFHGIFATTLLGLLAGKLLICVPSCQLFNSSVFELLPFSQTYLSELAEQHKMTERTEDLFHPVVSSNLTMSQTSSH